MIVEPRQHELLSAIYCDELESNDNRIDFGARGRYDSDGPVWFAEAQMSIIERHGGRSLIDPYPIIGRDEEQVWIVTAISLLSYAEEKGSRNAR